jgi:translation initiation factor 1
MANKKKRKNIVYSTNPDFEFSFEEGETAENLPPQQQQLRVFIDRKNRKGKSVTIVSGFEGSEKELKSLGKQLKSQCGVGGSVKEGEIVLQGEWAEKVLDILQKDGYQCKRSGS